MASRKPLPVDIHIGQKIQRLRSLKGKTQEALADSIGTTFQQLQNYENVPDRRHAMLVLHPLRHFDPEHGTLGYARRAVLGRLEAFAAEGRVAAEGVELVGGALAGLLGLHAFQAVVTHEDSPSIEGNGEFITWNDNPHARWGHAK